MAEAELWKIIVAEFLGTMMLVFVGCGSCINWSERLSPTIAQISLAFGLTVASMARVVGSISGCHINPAVTVGMLVAGKIDHVKALLYILFQCVGAVVGAGLLKVLTPDDIEGSLGMTLPNDLVESYQAVLIEFFITMILVLTVFGATEEGKNTEFAPLSIGFSIAACHFAFIPFTGSSMNSARTFGPAFVMKKWDSHWVYWVGPCAGGAVAALIYQFVLAQGQQQQQGGGKEKAKDYDSSTSVT